jgi:hypothetical protein
VERKIDVVWKTINGKLLGTMKFVYSLFQKESSFTSVRKANLQVVAGATVDTGGVCTAAISCLDTRASVV